MTTVQGDIKPLRKKIIVRHLEKGQQKTAGGILLPDDDGVDRGIRPRWAQVYRVGAGIDFVKEGEWILIEHGRWSRGITLSQDGTEFDVRLVDNECILATSDEQPEHINF
jgi:co-chaperonin GroES (HSP10)